MVINNVIRELGNKLFGAVQEVQQVAEINSGFDILYILENVAMQFVQLPTHDIALVGAVETISETIEGSCGGNAQVSGLGWGAYKYLNIQK